MAASRDLTRSVGWEVARRNPLVSSVKVGSCQRRASDRIICNATARGSSSALKTTCEVWVRVTLVDNHPKASRLGTYCDNEPLPLLRAFQALEAVRPMAMELGGNGVSVGTEGRLSRTEIRVTAAWIRPAPEPAKKELCAIHFKASLTPAETIAVEITDSFCVAS
jgi:hypothetical protein